MKTVAGLLWFMCFEEKSSVKLPSNRATDFNSMKEYIKANH